MHTYKKFLLIDKNIYNHFLISLKICFFVSFSLFNNNNLLNYKNIVELDNEIKNNWYENNEEYKNNDGIKIFCIYYPEYSFYKSKNVNLNNTFKSFSNLKKGRTSLPLFSYIFISR